MAARGVTQPEPSPDSRGAVSYTHLDVYKRQGHIDDICRPFGFDPLDYRLKMIMADAHVNKFSGNENYFDSPRQTLLAGAEAFGFRQLHAECEAQDPAARIRRGAGVASFWYNTGVWPIALESSASRMVLNLSLIHI